MSDSADTPADTSDSADPSDTGDASGNDALHVTPTGPRYLSPGEPQAFEAPPRDSYASSSDQVLIGVSFGDRFRAQEYLTEMTRLASLGSLKLRDAVIVSSDDNGDVRVRETIDPQPGTSAVSGAVWSGLLGLIFGGPVGWLAGMGIGAGVGALAAKVVDVGIPDEWVDWFRKAVGVGTTTVIILAEDLDVTAYERELTRFAGAHLVHATLPDATLHAIRSALHDDGVDPSAGARPAHHDNVETPDPQ